MKSLVLDTHSLVWFLNKSPNMSRTAMNSINQAIDGGCPIFFSVVSIIEIIHLLEKTRLKPIELEKIKAELQDENSALRLLPVTFEIASSLELVPRDKIPDMPDRIIAETALNLKLPLVTRDNRIRFSDIQTIW